MEDEEHLILKLFMLADMGRDWGSFVVPALGSRFHFESQMGWGCQFELQMRTGIGGWKLGIRVFVFEIGIRILVFQFGVLLTWHVLPTWIHSICWCVSHAS